MHDQPSRPQGNASRDQIFNELLNLSRQLEAIMADIHGLRAEVEAAKADRQEIKDRLEPIEDDRALAVGVRSLIARLGLWSGGILTALVALSQLFDWLRNWPKGDG